MQMKNNNYAYSIEDFQRSLMWVYVSNVDENNLKPFLKGNFMKLTLAPYQKRDTTL